MKGQTPELRLALALHRTSNALVRQFDRRLLEDHEVTFIQAMTLIAIGSIEPAQPTSVAASLCQQSQAMTGLIDRLERAGHLHRFRDLEDRRAVRLELTPSGRELATATYATLHACADDLFSRLEAADLRQLDGGVARIEATLNGDGGC